MIPFAHRCWLSGPGRFNYEEETMRSAVALLCDDVRGRSQTPVFECLEARAFLSVSPVGAYTLASAREKAVTHTMHLHTPRHRHWRHPSHTVTPTVLLGHFAGTSSGVFSKKADLTGTTTNWGHFAGSLLMDGFIF